MNPMDQLRDARPGHLDDGPVDERRRAAELSYAMAQPRERRRSRVKMRPMWGLSLLGAAAAATAVAVVVSSGGGTAPRAPAEAVASPTPELSARAFLLAAAHQVERAPDTMGDYWRTTAVRRTLFKVEGADYTVVDRERSESWTPSATGGKQWSRTQSLGAQPAGPADRAVWEQAGSPDKIPVVVPGKGKRALSLSTTAGKVEVGSSPLVDGDKVFWLGKNVTMNDLRGLPSTPKKLKAWLLHSYAGHSTESDEPMSQDPWLFAVTNGLIMDMPITPQVRGAAFRMLADLDTIKVTGGVTDGEGRKGTAVTIDQPASKDGGTLQHRLIIDEATGQALASETVVIEPGGQQADFAPGAVWNSYTVLEYGWIDGEPAAG